MLRDAKYFFRISRPFNILISLVAFSVGCFIANNQSLSFVKDFPFWATALTIAVIAAAGYWINDVYDFRIDRVNKPERTVVNAILSVKKVLTVYFFVNGAILIFSLVCLGVFWGYYHITFINFLSVGLLFVYASYLKRVGVAGNLTIAFLISLVLILSGYLYEVNIALVWAIIFAFEITLIREITKDVEDIKGDLLYDLRTLPIQVGIRTTRHILLGLYILFLISCYLPFLFRYWKSGVLLWPYLSLSAVLVQIPTLGIIYLLLNAVKPSAYSRQSLYLKYLMLCGILTLFALY